MTNQKAAQCSPCRRLTINRAASPRAVKAWRQHLESSQTDWRSFAFPDRVPAAKRRERVGSIKLCNQVALSGAIVDATALRAKFAECG